MIANNTVGTGVGFIPLVGSIFLGAWKPNSRNANLLEDCTWTLLTKSCASARRAVVAWRLMRPSVSMLSQHPRPTQPAPVRPCRRRRRPAVICSTLKLLFVRSGAVVDYEEGSNVA